MAKAKLGSGARFEALSRLLGRKPGVRDPKALAYSIGAKKYGSARMQAMAQAGRRQKR